MTANLHKSDLNTHSMLYILEKGWNAKWQITRTIIIISMIVQIIMVSGRTRFMVVSIAMDVLAKLKQ